MPYTTTDIADQFMRQFVEEEGGLVYRRHGQGTAYRVTEQETVDFLDDYMRRTRLHRIALVLATIAFGGGGALLLDASGMVPGEGLLVGVLIGFLVALLGAFVWFEMRSLTFPDRVLAARQAPVSGPIEKAEWSRAQLAKTPWFNFALVPLAGFYIVWALRDEVDPVHGWGRLMWLIPAALLALGGVQAWRKWRASGAR